MVTSNGFTTINSALSGSAGLNKTGAGSLALRGVSTFTGNVTVSGGVLEIGSDEALGDAGNDLINSGTLKTTSSVSLGAGRDLAGTGTLDIADGTTLTINGVTSTAGLTLANTGTLAFNNAASNPGNLTTTYTSGTARITGNLNFGAADKVVNVAGGGALEISGGVALTTSTGVELTKEGTGTLILSGSGSSISRVQLGRAGTIPTAGGTLRVLDASGLGAQELYLNYGTLEVVGNQTTTVGVSLGGRVGSETILGGVGGDGDLTFNGAARFFGATGTTGDAVLNVNNTTKFAGGISGASSTISGVRVGGTGTLIVDSSASSAFTTTITTTNSVKLVNNSNLGGGVIVSAGTTLAGSGSFAGAATIVGTHTPGNSPGIQTFSAGLTYDPAATLVWELSKNLNDTLERGIGYDGINVTGGTLTIGSGAKITLDFDNPLADGTVSAVDWSNVFWDSNRTWTIVDVANLGTAVDTNPFVITNSSFVDALGASLSTVRAQAFFEILRGTDGDVLLSYAAIPEPSSQMLMMLGLAGLAGMRAIRRKQS